MISAIADIVTRDYLCYVIGMRTSTEFRARVYNDTTGDYVEIGHDYDGLGLCRIDRIENHHEPVTMIVEWEVVEEIARAICKLLELREAGQQ